MRSAILVPLNRTINIFVDFPFETISSLTDSSARQTRRIPIILIRRHQQRSSISCYSFLPATDSTLCHRFHLLIARNYKAMNVSGDTIIFVTVMLLMHCSCGICSSNYESNHQQQQMHDRTKRFVFLKTSGIGVSGIAMKLGLEILI